MQAQAMGCRPQNINHHGGIRATVFRHVGRHMEIGNLHGHALDQRATQYRDHL